MNSVVTQRFIRCHDKLLASNQVRSSRQFAISLDYLPQSLSEIMKGRRDATIELIRKAVEVFKINPQFLFLGEGEMFVGERRANNEHVLTVVTDQFQEERIVHIPVPAQAGYGGQITDPYFFNELESFSLPGYNTNHGTHRSFDISGDSMEPTLFEGDKLVCSYVDQDQWKYSLKDGYVYVIVTQSDIVVKRIKNKISESGSIIMVSDNSFYEDKALPINLVKEIWYVKIKISPFMNSPSNARNGFGEELNGMRDLISNQSSVISNLNSTIEKLLKQNRSRI